MATDFKSIPIIDLAPMLSKCDDQKMAQDPEVSEVVKQLDQACREAGFFYVKGHGIPDFLLKEVKNLTHKFFELPYEEKLKIKMTPATGYRGYQRIRENITKGVPDMHEAIDFYKEVKSGIYGAVGKPIEGCNQWPLDPPKFKEIMEEYINLCTGIFLILDSTLFTFAFPGSPGLNFQFVSLSDLSKKIMRGIALALGGSPIEFEGNRAGDAFWVARVIGYPGIPSTNGHVMPTNDIGCGAHTDYGLLTLVNQDDDITALQVRNFSGEWILAPPVPGTFVCNIGDMLKVYSNGLYESTLHRVINNSTKYRVCVAYFYETNFETAVEPLDACVQKTGGAKKFERAVVYGEHMVAKEGLNSWLLRNGRYSVFLKNKEESLIASWAEPRYQNSRSYTIQIVL